MRQGQSWSWLLLLLIFGLAGPAWSAPATQYTLLSLGDREGLAIDKDDDTVVGAEEDAQGAERAIIIFPTFRDLGRLPDGLFARATAVPE